MRNPAANRIPDPVSVARGCSSRPGSCGANTRGRTKKCNKLKEEGVLDPPGHTVWRSPAATLR